MLVQLVKVRALVDHVYDLKKNQKDTGKDR